MSDDATEVRRLLAVFRDRPLSVDPERIELRRRRVVPALREHVNIVAAERKRARLYRLGAVGAAAVAAVAAAIALLVFDVQPRRFLNTEASASRPEGLQIQMLEGRLRHHGSGVERAIVAGESLSMPIAGEFRTPHGSSARLQSSSGMALDIDGASRVSLAGMDPAGSQRYVSLLSGKLRCTVPTLEPGRRFAVVTPNARAVVHGTEFSVEVDAPAEGVTRTCVRVDHGVVVVHDAAGQMELGAGRSWGCDERASETAADRAGEPPERAAAHALGSTRGSLQRTSKANGAVRGTLAEETRLLQTALAAERGGQTALAGERLRTLLARYPDSPLAPEARQALERVARHEPPGP